MNRERRALVIVGGAQLAVGFAGLGVALRRRHAYDFFVIRGRRDRMVAESVVMGTALSAPGVMLAAQAGALAVLARGESEPAARVLTLLGALMVPGYLGEKLTRTGLRRGAWNGAELRIALAGTALAGGMVALGSRMAQAP